jgi:hypothetical protein
MTDIKLLTDHRPTAGSLRLAYVNRMSKDAPWALFQSDQGTFYQVRRYVQAKQGDLSSTDLTPVQVTAKQARQVESDYGFKFLYWGKGES